MNKEKKTNKTPIISIVMPVYNGEKYLKEAIDSILNQTYKYFEFIIINDGSTDRSEEIILSYADSRIRYIKNETNLKLIKTLNKGIQLSEGEYIVRMDADDISLPNRLLLQIDFMQKNPNVGLCSGNAISIGPEGNIISGKWWDTNNLPIKWLLIWENPIAHPTIMLRKETLLTNKLSYDTRKLHAEDYELWCKMAHFTNIERLNDIILKYRVSESSIYRNNFRTSCNNSLDTNREYIKKIISEDSPKIHKYFTTFSEALG